jgi:hypothetical protein
MPTLADGGDVEADGGLEPAVRRIDDE